jgi:hypothetical protein
MTKTFRTTKIESISTPKLILKYESVNIGTVTWEGYAIDILEHELFFREKKWDQDFFIQDWDVPSKHLLRHLQELQNYG